MSITYPHCDPRILHAPGVCETCDRYAARFQELRRGWGINFTGEHDPDKLPCPADFARGPTHQLWGGNRPGGYESPPPTITRRQRWRAKLRRLAWRIATRLSLVVLLLSFYPEAASARAAWWTQGMCPEQSQPWARYLPGGEWFGVIRGPITEVSFQGKAVNVFDFDPSFPEPWRWFEYACRTYTPTGPGPVTESIGPLLYPLPEPSTASGLGAGALLLFALRRARR